MGNLSKFISYLHEQVQNHSIYVWGAQGQQGSAITEAWIKSAKQARSTHREPYPIGKSRSRPVMAMFFVLSTAQGLAFISFWRMG